MKIIISRKGFDAKYGGCASPIFSDGTMVSLPIPSSRPHMRYRELNIQGRNIGSVVESISRGKISRNATTHFDPDLCATALPRSNDWRPAFGQTQGQLTHLMNCGVAPGDLFLFFGWFREVEEKSGGVIVKTSSGQNRHVIFGWLQVDTIIDVGPSGQEAASQYPWLKAHPHVLGTWGAKNSIFIATERLHIPNNPELNFLPGGGTFENFAAARCLTKEGQSRRSQWSLPAGFAPQHGDATLSFHGNPKRWTPDSDPTRVLLDSAKIGQEFVLESRKSELINNWAASIFNDQPKTSVLHGANT